MSQEKLKEDNAVLKPHCDETVDPKSALKAKRPSDASTDENKKSFAEQVKHYERRIRAYQKAKDKNSEGEALSNLGILYYKGNKFFEARSCHERHLNLAKSTLNKRAEKRAYCNLGCTYRRIGNFDRAIECYEQGLKLVKELHDKNGEAKLLNNLGNIFEQQSDFDQAIYYHHQRLKVAKELKDLDGESKACASLGNIYHLLGNIRESISYYEKLVACLKYKLVLVSDQSKQEKKAKSDGSWDKSTLPCSSSSNKEASGQFESEEGEAKSSINGGSTGRGTKNSTGRSSDSVLSLSGKGEA